MNRITVLLLLLLSSNISIADDITIETSNAFFKNNDSQVVEIKNIPKTSKEINNQNFSNLNEIDKEATKKRKQDRIINNKKEIIKELSSSKVSTTVNRNSPYYKLDYDAPKYPDQSSKSAGNVSFEENYYKKYNVK